MKRSLYFTIVCCIATILFCAYNAFGVARPIMYVPSGTGIPHVASGAQINTAGLVANSDVDPAAAIGITKLATCGGGTVFHGGVSNNSCSAVALGTDVTGTLPIANGGTGQTSFASGALSSNGSALTSGTLSLANGGTGQTSFSAGALISNGSALSSVAPGTSGNVLTSNGTTWVSQAAAGGSSIGYGLYASRPAAGTAGKMYIPSDGWVPFVDDGANWRPYLNGRVGMQPPAAAGWTIVNAAGGTLADDHGTLLYTAPSLNNNTSSNAATACRSLPATPFTLTVGFKYNGAPLNVTGVGLAYRDSGTGRLINFSFVYNSAPQFQIQYLNNPTSWASNVLIESWPSFAMNVPTFYFHLYDPGGTGNLIWKASVDGDYTNAVRVYNGASRTAWTATPDSICLEVLPENVDTRGTVSMHIFDWTVQ